MFSRKACSLPRQRRVRQGASTDTLRQKASDKTSGRAMALTLNDISRIRGRLPPVSPSSTTSLIATLCSSRPVSIVLFATSYATISAALETVFHHHGGGREWRGGAVPHNLEVSSGSKPSPTWRCSTLSISLNLCPSLCAPHSVPLTLCLSFCVSHSAPSFCVFLFVPLTLCLSITAQCQGTAEDL